MNEITYEIRKDGRAWVRSSIPDCGYSPEELRSLRNHGFRLHAVKKAGQEKEV